MKKDTVHQKEQVKTTTDKGTRLFSGNQEIQPGYHPSNSGLGIWMGQSNFNNLKAFYAIARLGLSHCAYASPALTNSDYSQAETKEFPSKEIEQSIREDLRF